VAEQASANPNRNARRHPTQDPLTVAVKRRTVLGFGATSVIGLGGCAADRSFVAEERLAALRAVDFNHEALRGFAIGTLDSRRDDAYMKAAAGYGANLLRLFVGMTRTRSGRFELDTVGRDELWRILGHASRHSLHTVLVLDLAGVAMDSFWRSEELQAGFVDAWGTLARVVQNTRAVAGLDLLNEPNPPWDGRDVEFPAQTWSVLAERAIDAIRGAGCQLPIVFEPVFGAASSGLAKQRLLRDPNVVYSIHYYTPHDITHQTLESWRRRIPYPAPKEWGLGLLDPAIGAGPWGLREMELSLRHTIAFQAQHRVPIYVGEFSCIRWAPDGSALRYVADLFTLIQKYGWSWTYHDFRGWPGWDAEIASHDAHNTFRSDDAPMIRLLSRNMSRR
jgi:endoglucanase